VIGDSGYRVVFTDGCEITGWTLAEILTEHYQRHGVRICATQEVTAGE